MEPLRLPRSDDRTLNAYLLSAANTIHEKINTGLQGDAAARLRECATVIARVAQQISAGRDERDWDLAAEIRALETGEAAFAEAEAVRAQAGLQPAPPTARRIIRADVEAYLQQHPKGGPNAWVTALRLLPGGRCKLTALVSQEGAASLPASFILRQDWQGGATETTVAEEFALLECVCAAGILAPKPLLLEARATAVGAPFILLERMPGAVSGSLFTPPRSAQLAREFAVQLGRLHNMPAAPLRNLVKQAPASADALAEMIQGFAAMQTAIGIQSQVIGAAITWLTQNLALAGDDVALIHNDLGFHNFLVEDDHLTALLDWELAELGHPASDLGYIKHFISLMLPWEEFLAHYRAAGGRMIAPETLRFHTIFNAVRLYGLIMRARAALASGLVNDVEISFACADNNMLLLRALASELSA